MSILVTLCYKAQAILRKGPLRQLEGPRGTNCKGLRGEAGNCTEDDVPGQSLHLRLCVHPGEVLAEGRVRGVGQSGWERVPS